jgi:AcrR family transcriptional regulator
MSAPRTSREKLLDLASRVFAEEGYAAASVRDIAARTDLTSGAIYGNFGSKANLLLAAIDALIAEDLVQVPPEGISRVADVLADLYERYPERRQLRALLVEGAAAGRSDPEVRERLAADQAERISVWADIYRTWQERGEIAPDVDLHAALTLLWATELGLGVLEAMGVPLPDGDKLGDVVRRQVEGLAGRAD